MSSRECHSFLGGAPPKKSKGYSLEEINLTPKKQQAGCCPLKKMAIRMQFLKYYP